MNYLINYAHENNITSFYRLKKEAYKIFREKYPELPSHYIYTACQMATSIYKNYRKRRRRGKANGRPVFKKDVIMLDDHLFKLYLERAQRTRKIFEGGEWKTPSLEFQETPSDNRIQG